jgi:hypothetical protein
MLGIIRSLVDGRRIRVHPAHDPAGREATGRVRHEVYCVEKGFLDGAELFDHHDERATLLNAFAGSEPVGTLRITDSADGPLEIFEMHPELQALVPPGRRYVEISRLMVVRRYRGFHATVPLFRRAFQEIIARGVDGVLVSCAQGLIPYYSRLMGFRQISTRPLAHGRLRGLTDYAMILHLPEVLAYVTPARIPLWVAISPTWFVRALGMTAARRARALLRRPPRLLEAP